MTDSVRKTRHKRSGKSRWNGLLAGYSSFLRRITALVLAVTCVTLTFTQLGFAGIGSPGAYSSYAIILLLPLALCALLLGKWAGLALGLFAGSVLYVHALIMPLDPYELSFVTPFSSIVLLSVTGFILGALFALALRNNPSPVRSIVYIALVCLIVSSCYSFAFIINIFITLINRVADRVLSGMGTDDVESIVQTTAVPLGLRLGDPLQQALVDTVLMTFVCAMAYIIVSRLRRVVGAMGIRALFSAWLGVVILLAFMVTAGVSFVSISYEEQHVAGESLNGEMDYLCSQLETASRRKESLFSLLGDMNLDLDTLNDEEYLNLSSVVSTDGILDGFTKASDGTVFIYFTAEGTEEDGANGEFPCVLVSADPRFSSGDDLRNLLDSDVLSGIERSVSTGQVVRVIYDEGYSSKIDKISSELIRSQIAFLLARKSMDYTVVMMRTADMVFADRTERMAWTTWSFLALLLVVFTMTFLLLSRLVAQRIDETNEVLARVAKGDLNARVKVNDTREFSSLTMGINETVDALKGWIDEAESRMDAELTTAKTIQESAIPRIFPPFPDNRRFDIYASMNAAKEVGGDFYDFFLIGDDSDSTSGKLGFIIADVSGKGVPAALFMMRADTLLRDYLSSGMEPGEAVENANRQLCDGNDAAMFVTVWVGVLDYATGHVDYVNAGHNPPLLWSQGSWAWLTQRSGLPLGLFDGLPYESYSFDCQIGDELLLYTDGVTEAMSVDGEQYSEERLMELVQKNFTAHPRELVESIRHDVAIHATDAEQSDDITILALEVGVPPEVTATLVVPANTDELPRVRQFIHTELDRRLCPLRAQQQLDIAVEELFVNVCHYAYSDATPDAVAMVRVSYTYSSEPPSVKIDIIDEGRPFNPLSKPDAVTPDDIRDVPIGGLGILMAKNSVDDLSYEYIEGNNIVSLTKAW